MKELFAGGFVDHFDANGVEGMNGDLRHNNLGGGEAGGPVVDLRIGAFPRAGAEHDDDDEGDQRNEKDGSFDQEGTIDVGEGAGTGFKSGGIVIFFTGVGSGGNRF